MADSDQLTAFTLQKVSRGKMRQIKLAAHNAHELKAHELKAKN
jgi:hypothetical protein